MQNKLILIAGPTASGKSKLAVNLASKINGEIINADSMQVYKDFSILTSRPNQKEKKKYKTPSIWNYICKRRIFSWKLDKISKEKS